MTDRGCSVDGCPRPHAARGLCHAHWSHARNHGTLDQHELVGPTRPGDILSQVAADHGCTVPDILGRDRTHADARHDAAHRLRDLDLSSTQIGKRLGGRDHTTVLYSLSKPRPDVPAQPMPQWPDCTVPACDRDTKSLGLCEGHYRRWERDGDIRPDVPLRAMFQTGPVLDLEAHNRTGYRDGCRCETCRADAVRAVKRNRHSPKRVPVAEGLAALDRAVATGISIPKVAAAVGVGNACLYHWRSGRAESCSRDTVEAIAKLAEDRAVPRCEDCDTPALAGGRWCWDCYRARARPQTTRTGCGTDAGYTAHRRAGTTPCPACREAHTRASARRAS